MKKRKKRASFPVDGALSICGRKEAEKLSDKELIDRIRQGESGQMDVLVERYYDEIFRYCYYRTGNGTAAADCTQDTFLHMIRGFGSYVDRNRFRPWLFRIAANACMDYFRKNREICVEEELLWQQGCEDKGLKQKEEEAYVQAALLQLSGIQREAVILKFYHGFKIREIAKMLGITVPAAKSRLKQGIDRLKTIMKGEDFADETKRRPE